MHLIDKEHGCRPVCGYCHRANGGGHYTRARKKNWLCDQCFHSVLRESIRKSTEQVTAGVPFDLRYSEIPGGFLKFADELWFEALRTSLLSAEQSRRASIMAVIREAKASCQ